MFGDLADRRLWLLGILCSVLCLWYLQLLEQGVFAGDYLSPIFRFLLTTYDATTAWLSLLICVIAAAWHKTTPVLRLIGGIASKPLWFASICVIAVALGAVAVYHRCPLSMDEFAAVFQARIFAAGRVTAHFPPSVIDWLVLPHFNGMFLTASRQTGEVMEAYWPGFSLLLAPFEFLGVPWLCNALLAGSAVYLVFLITRELVNDEQAAAWAMLFTLGSSEFLANGISLYPMQAHLTTNLLFVWLLIKPRPSSALAAGLVGSLALVLHNPVPHLLFGTPWVVWVAMHKDRRSLLPPLILGYVPAVAVAVGWLSLRNSLSPADSLLTWSAGLQGIFTFPDAVLLNMRAASTVKLWIWAIPCLYLLALSGYLTCRAKVEVRLLTQSALLTFAGYFFVRLDQGHGWGFRYFHSAWGAIPILAGCAMSKVAAPTGRLVSFAGATSALSLLILVPFQMNQIDAFISRHLAQIPHPISPGNNVYFLTGKGGFYILDMIQNDPFLRDRNLVLASRGLAMDAELIRQDWPGAVLARQGEWGWQWYLGDHDRRQSIESSGKEKHFVLTFSGVVTIAGPSFIKH
jgi:hypothetical protein